MSRGACSREELAGLYERRFSMVYQICLVLMKSIPDAEDAAQTVFRKVMERTEPFRDPEHEKAWLIRVTLNACKDLKRKLFRHSTVPLEVLSEEAASVVPEQMEILEIVLSLPAKYKDAIYLHYYEGYTAKEIGTMLHKKENTVYSLLSRGRELLKQKLGGGRDV